MEVAFCAAAVPAPHFSHPREPLMGVGARMVNLEHLLPEIRFKGNAYGAGCYHDGLGRAFVMHSYRDPQVAPTLKVFSGVLDYIRSARWEQADVDRNIIGKAKEDEEPIRPEAATRLALGRHLTGQTPEVRERRYAKILSANPKSVKSALLEMLEENLPRMAVCVVSSRAKLEEANRQMPEGPMEIQDIQA
jgi:Zn-dependent M16 (insulinase) family peptidase